MKTKKRNRKLLFQVCLITIGIFFLSYTLTVLSYIFLSKEAYLSSKQEMIDYDLRNSSNNISLYTPRLDWFISYEREHPEETRSYPTFEEKTIYDSDEYTELYFSFSEDDNFDPEKENEQKQLYLARMTNNVLKVAFEGVDRDILNYDRRYVLIPENEHESFLIGEIGDDKLENSVGTTITYEASEHSAIGSILSGEVTGQEQTIYEDYYDPSEGKVYYIGYSPVIVDDEVKCYLCLWYDWSDFSNKLFAYVGNSLITELIIVIVLNGLLMLFLYLNAIFPLSKVKRSVQKYMSDKNSSSVVSEMDNIKVRNEVGVLADNFSALTSEIDRYTKENLKLCSEKERIATELDLATKIQSDMIPDIFPERTEFDLFASMDPAKEVGGDFYDFFYIDEDHLALVIADVSGKGVPAALFMMSSMILIKDHTLMGGTPAEILDIINKQICSNNEAKMFVTVWLGILEISTGKLTTSSAGHEYPFININGKYELFKDKHGMPIGTFKKSKYKNEELILKNGDSIFVYTDGVAEATDKDNNLFGTERTLEALNASPDALPKDVLKNVRGAVDGFIKDAPQFDDLTMLCLRYNGYNERSEQN